MGDRQPISDILGTMQDISTLIQESKVSPDPNGRQERIMTSLLDVNSYLGNFGTDPMQAYPEIDGAMTHIRGATGCLQNAFVQKESSVAKFDEALAHIEQSRTLVEQAYNNPEYQ